MKRDIGNRARASKNTRVNSAFYRVTQKLAHHFCTPTFLPYINRFSKLFHSQNHEKICNDTITKDPTTPQVCRYTTL